MIKGLRLSLSSFCNDVHIFLTKIDQLRYYNCEEIF